MKKVNILGSGTMGCQIAALFLLLDYEVNIWTRIKKDNEILKKIKIEQKILSRYFNISNLKLGKISFKYKIEELKENITIESLSEDIGIKNDILNKLKFEKNIFTNTSSYLINDFNKSLSLLHFCNPIFLNFCEINFNLKFVDEKAYQLLDDLKGLSFDLINVDSTSGFLINKLIFSNISNFFYLLEVEQIKYSELLNLNKKFNIFDLSILKTIDIIGIDICFSIFKNLNKHNNYYRIPKTLSKALDKNILGKKNKTSITSIEIFKT